MEPEEVRKTDPSGLMTGGCPEGCQPGRKKSQGEPIAHPSDRMEVPGFPKNLSHIKIEITKETRVSEIEAYGDIADVMEVFGIKRVGRYSLRMLAAKAVTVEWAAHIHRVPLDEFLKIVEQAVAKRSKV